MNTFNTRDPDPERAYIIRPSAARMQGDEVDLSEFLHALYRRKWLIAGCALAMAGLFFLLSSQMTTYYTARATLMLDPRDTQISASQEIVSDLQLSNPILDSEVAVIQSNQLLEQVITGIGVARIDALYAEANAPAPPLRWLKSLVSRPADSSAPPEAPPLIPPERAQMNRVFSQLRKGLSVDRVGQSYVIEILASTVDPQLSSLVANGLANGYIQRQVAGRQEVALSATKWLAGQVDTQRAQVEQAETAVEDFKSEQLAVQGPSSEILSQQMVELNAQLAQVRAEILEARAQVQQVEMKLNSDGAGAVGDQLSSPIFATLREQRLALLQEDANLATRLGAEHPQRRQVASVIAQLDAEMAAEADKIIQGFNSNVRILEFREQALMQSVSDLETQLSQISRSSLKLRQLEREHEALLRTYEDLLARLTEARSQVELQRAEALLINAAEIPGAPSAPRPKLLTAFGGVLGLVTGLIAALVRETSSSGFARGAQLEAAFGLPVLGTLPKGRWSGPGEVYASIAEDPYSLFSERLRQLRETLLSRKERGLPRSYLLLSSVPDEGKSTTAMSLARMFAMSSRATILIDLDTRQSTICQEAGLEMEHDLSDYLSGKVALNKAIVRSPGAGFDVLGSQTGKGILSDTLKHSELAELIETLKQHYDIVVIDAPPVLAVSDSLLLAGVADSLLYLVRWRKTPKRAVSMGLAHLDSIGVRPEGVVLTMVSIKQDPDYYVKQYSYG